MKNSCIECVSVSDFDLISFLFLIHAMQKCVPFKKFLHTLSLFFNDNFMKTNKCYYVALSYFVAT